MVQYVRSSTNGADVVDHTGWSECNVYNVVCGLNHRHWSCGRELTEYKLIHVDVVVFVQATSGAQSIYTCSTESSYRIA